MLNIRPILLALGTILSILAAFMLIPALVDAMSGNADWQAFLISAFFTAFVGVAMILTNMGDKSSDLNLKQAFILTTSTWVLVAGFAALPFMFAHIGMSYTDGYFEAMSGLTTTGASVMTKLDGAPPGILLWRALLHWLGGIGIIVMAMAILPMLKIGGMQLFRTESSDKYEKIMPRVAQVSAAITGVYTMITLISALALYTAGMSFFDAFCHSAAALATGGFSTHDASVAFFNSPLIEFILILTMAIGGLPFVLLVQFFRGKPLALFSDTQVKGYIVLLIASSLILTFWLVETMDLKFWDALRRASFNAVSVITTTGFASDDFSKWGSFAVVVFFMLSAFGGCTGSTSGAIKIFRFQVLYEVAKTQLKQLVQPHGVFKPRYNNKPISESEVSSVLSFFILYALTFSVLALVLSSTGLDFTTSMSASAAALGNVGPSLAEIGGPVGNYSTVTDLGKWAFSFGMMVGRLELFTVFVLFSPYFWKN